METLPDRKAKTALDAFERYKTRLELRTGKRIKTVRTDQGTEFNGDFSKYLVSNGITKQKGFSYFHTHPGKAERVHQTILQQGRAMLIAANLPPMFYADSQLTAAYIHNRTVHSADNMTPYKHIYGERPDISHLHPFGCIAYAHVPAELRSKLDPAAEKCRLLGYPALSKDPTYSPPSTRVQKHYHKSLISPQNIMSGTGRRSLNPEGGIVKY
jgi:hypothetical protein